MRERRLSRGGVQHGVVEAIEFELEEQQLRRGVDDLVVRVAIKFRAGRIGGVAGVEQAGEGHDAAEQILQRLVARDRLAERFAGLRVAGERPRACRDSPARNALASSRGALEIGACKAGESVPS